MFSKTSNSTKISAAPVSILKKNSLISQIFILLFIYPYTSLVKNYLWSTYCMAGTV